MSTARFVQTVARFTALTIITGACVASGLTAVLVVMALAQEVAK